MSADRTRALWRRAARYGLALAAGLATLAFVDAQRLAGNRWADAALLLVTAAFLALGVWIGARRWQAPAPPPGNPAAVESLGISPRELAVLAELAAGGSTKEIARTLGVSPNTVKTHLARLFEKLGASRRTEAIARARDLGILP